jgi:hypothetical protein
LPLTQRGAALPVGCTSLACRFIANESSVCIAPFDRLCERTFGMIWLVAGSGKILRQGVITVSLQKLRELLAATVISELVRFLLQSLLY